MPLAKGKGRDGLVMRAIPSEVTFIEDELANRLRLGGKGGMAFKPGVGIDAGLAAPGKGYMGQEGPPLRCQPRLAECPTHLSVQRVERPSWDRPGEQHALPALIEKADTVKPDLYSGRADRAERRGNVVRHRALDLADEAQGDMKLGIVLPRPAGRPAGHGRKAAAAYFHGRTEGYKQAVHVIRLGFRGVTV